MDNTKISLWKKRKKELGWTHDDLAKESGVSRRTIAGIFSGAPRYESPTYNTIQAIEKALGLSNDNDFWTAEDYENGVQDVKKISISPIEEDMLIAFRELGEKHGEKAQNLIISIIEKMNTSL